MSRSNQKASSGKGDAIDRFKWEITEELGLADKVRQVGWENMTTREVGHIGGQMVKKMIEAAEESLRQREELNVNSFATAPSTISSQRMEMLDHLYKEPITAPGLSEVQKQVAWGSGEKDDEHGEGP